MLGCVVREIKASKIDGDATPPASLPRRATGWPTARKTTVARTSCRFRSGRIDLIGVVAQRIVNLTLLLVAQNIVGLGDCLEPFFRLFVTGIHVRMVLARELAEGLAD